MERPGLAEALRGVSGEPATVGLTAVPSSPREAVGQEMSETRIVSPDSSQIAKLAGSLIFSLPRRARV